MDVRRGDKVNVTLTRGGKRDTVLMTVEAAELEEDMSGVTLPIFLLLRSPYGLHELEQRDGQWVELVWAPVEVGWHEQPVTVHE